MKNIHIAVNAVAWVLLVETPLRATLRGRWGQDKSIRLLTLNGYKCIGYLPEFELFRLFRVVGGVRSDAARLNSPSDLLNSTCFRARALPLCCPMHT
ncbi:hypothetical protein DBV15_08951 [Temnothorax longispinosus]|uniref:Secreted protein n=1 Tax=Temnothorax longispinosus TaxID=300112 RepID=A0A4S2JCF7_9HYME|nr:hypothetical protein DBV15_08951 [Temnothorax longispinosus]